MRELAPHKGVGDVLLGLKLGDGWMEAGSRQELGSLVES